MTKLFYLTATLGLLVAVPVQAQEQECFAGFSCHEAAEACPGAAARNLMYP